MQYARISNAPQDCRQTATVTNRNASQCRAKHIASLYFMRGDSFRNSSLFASPVRLSQSRAQIRSIIKYRQQGFLRPRPPPHRIGDVLIGW